MGIVKNVRNFSCCLSILFFSFLSFSQVEYGLGTFTRSDFSTNLDVGLRGQMIVKEHWIDLEIGLNTLSTHFSNRIGPSYKLGYSYDILPDSNWLAAAGMSYLFRHETIVDNVPQTLKHTMGANILVAYGKKWRPFISYIGGINIEQRYSSLEQNRGNHFNYHWNASVGLLYCF